MKLLYEKLNNYIKEKKWIGGMVSTANAALR